MNNYVIIVNNTLNKNVGNFGKILESFLFVLVQDLVVQFLWIFCGSFFENFTVSLQF